MSNIDAQEVAKFDAIAAQWWDVNGDFKYFLTLIKTFPFILGVHVWGKNSYY